VVEEKGEKKTSISVVEAVLELLGGYRRQGRCDKSSIELINSL